MTIAALTLVGAFVATTAIGAITRTDGTYVLDIDLSRPTTTQPASGSTLQYPTDPIKLAWRPVPGASKYQVQIARAAASNADCTSSSAWQAGNVMLTYETSELGWVPELTDATTGKGIWTGTFCWRVRASSNARIPGQWSSGSKFTLSWTAKAANPRFYSDESGDVPRAPGTPGDTTGFDTGYLEWDPVAGATQYEVQISNAQTFSVASLFAEKVYPATRLLLPQMPDNQYTWRVRPVTSTGIKGSWSDIASFRIFHDDRYWGGSANATSNTLYPTSDTTTNDLRIGWEPVPGASYYRYQVMTEADLFPEHNQVVSYGTPIPNTPCQFYEGRITSQDEKRSSTINNWATAGGILDDAVVENLGQGCEYDPTPPVGTPPVDPNPNDDNTKVYPDLPSEIYWRVYPVWRLSSSTEQGWKVADSTILGKGIQRHFTLEPYDATQIGDPAVGPVPQTATRYCKQGGTTKVDCLRNTGTFMSPLNSSPHSTTMQVPVFEWGTYPGANPNEGPDSFRVSIAQDPAFVFQIAPDGVQGTDRDRGWIADKGPERREAWAPDSTDMYRFGGITRSFALNTGLPDEGQVDGNGYFWRSVPCNGGTDVVCQNKYNEFSDLSPGLAFGVPFSGAPEFRKRVEVSTSVVSGFTPTTPMLKVGPVGASTFAEWQRGIQGADHYEFEIARNQAFDENDKVYKTTVPRIVPWGGTPADVVAPGTWFWRVRAVDRDGLAGSWSSTSSFTATSPAPVVSSNSTSLGVGGTVEWSPVNGAIGYEIEWSTDDGFPSDLVTTKETAQTAYYIPAAAAGSLYWRVRAKTGDEAFGEWSDPRKITILSASRIPFGVSSKVTSAGSYAIAEGQLIVAGTARNGQKVTLQRKSAACDASGSYATYGSGTTGDRIDDGIVRFRVRAMNSRCYRFAWQYATGTLYSAAFEIGARPVVSFTPLQRRVRRGREFCSAIRSNVPITGRIQVQYKVGRVWVTAKTANVTGMRTRRQCAAINRGGVFPVRLLVDRMANLEDTTADGGTVKTADSFQIVR